MPFTFAHPAAAMPFLRYKKHFCMEAMILGCMAPDYEYFLRGRPYGNYGHTLQGIMLFDLPLVVAVYFVGMRLVLPVIAPYLPYAFQSKRQRSRNGVRAALVFAYSALIGVLTHIVWDSFTHVDGAVVKHVAMLATTITIHGFGIPMYKILQHGSTLVGLIVIAWFLLRRCRRHGMVEISTPLRSKAVFWSMLIALAVLILMIWNAINTISASQIGILAVRSIDSAIISLLALSAVLKLGSIMNRRL
jgi:hypothetical protein